MEILFERESTTENKRTIGSQWENTAAGYLERKGYTVIAKNYRCRIGEIDIIARDKEYLVFVEVKYRKNADLGSPFEAVSQRKQRTISRTADYYRMTRRISLEVPCRFDVVGICGENITVIQNAFEYCTS